MNLAEALTQASQNYGWVIGRPPGQVIEIARLGGLFRLTATGKRHQWHPNIRDIFANDWVAGDISLVVKLITERAAQVSGGPPTNGEGT